MVVVIKNTEQARAIMRRLASAASAQAKPSVSAGFLSGQRYGSGTPVATVAAVQEFGAVINRSKASGRGQSGVQVIPPRPFMRPAVQQHARHWAEVVQAGLRQALAAESAPQGVAQALFNPSAVLEQVGQVMVTDIRNTILGGGVSPDAPSTAEQKHATTPLVHTGTLLNAVTARVQV